ncbi:NAD-dependent epimerase/dehydratase family protein [Nocardioides campestrisoli]|uniref:NAD-dependent epimerase/dehydratase family protein n=1 Tax=Nocardioides campestrisoli TaxID=2736757 RepID=UPI0015E69EA7|nr:NAD-dependent epimerase/dehydratase family protein [Nocardioides campestrisoli]
MDETAATVGPHEPLKRLEPLKCVIAGGSGSLGRPLADHLAQQGHEVVVLTRRPSPDLGHRQVRWDGRTVGGWVEELAEPRRTAVVNLAGELVDRSPTPANARLLLDSRVRPTHVLVEASRLGAEPLAHWVQASTTAIWSDGGERRITESTPLPEPGLPQMTGVARPWEAASDGAHTSHRVLLRTSLVLQPGSPLLTRLSGVTRAGLGGRLGSGRQWISWIHVDDWLRVVAACLDLVPGVRIPSGPLVASSDRPLRNAEMMAALRAHYRRPVGLPAPGFAVRVGARVLGSDPALALTGRHCTSQVLERAGWSFDVPTFQDALARIGTAG